MPALSEFPVWDRFPWPQACLAAWKQEGEPEEERRASGRLPFLSELLLIDARGLAAQRSRHMAAQAWFNGLAAAVTASCAVVLGVSLDQSFGTAFEDRTLYFLLDVLFGLFFFVEFCVRQHQLGWDYYCDIWNVLDYLLVAINLSDLLESVVSEDGGFQLAAALRVVRILRIARSLQGIRAFYGMWLLLEALLGSLKTMVWTGLLILILVYTCSILFMSVVADTELVRERFVHAEQYMGSVMRTMLTVTQVFTLDSWASEFARPLLRIGDVGGAVLCVVTIVLCNLGALNLIVSLMVEKITVLRRQSESRSKKLLRSIDRRVVGLLRADFEKAMSKRADDVLDLKEFRAVIAQPEVAAKFQLLDISPGEVRSLFDLLDVARAGSVYKEDLLEGLSRLRGPVNSKDILLLVKFITKRDRMTKEFLKRTRQMVERADRMQARFDEMLAVVRVERRFRAGMEARTAKVWDEARGVKEILNVLETKQAVYFPHLDEGSDLD